VFKSTPKKTLKKPLILLRYLAKRPSLNRTALMIFDPFGDFSGNRQPRELRHRGGRNKYATSALCSTC
jgi:hypothetical protein